MCVRYCSLFLVHLLLFILLIIRDIIIYDYLLAVVFQELRLRIHLIFTAPQPHEAAYAVETHAQDQKGELNEIQAITSV